MILPLLVGAVVFIAALQLIAARRRQETLARLRTSWGRAVPPRALDDDDASEAWSDLLAYDAPEAAIDDRTWVDLTLDECVATIDRTHTPLGRQILFRRMRSGANWLDEPKLEEMALLFQRSDAAREWAAIHLKLCGGLGRGFWWITRPDAILVRWWYWLFPLLTLSMLGCIALLFIFPQAAAAITILLVVNMGARVVAEWQVPRLLTSMRQVGPLIQTAHHLTRTPGTEAPGIATDLKDLRSLRRIASWVSRDPAKVGEMLASLYEYLNIVLLLDANALLFGSRSLTRFSPSLRRVAEWVGDVDVALTVASLRAEPRPWCVPVFAADRETTLAGVWHPLLAEPVPNDVSLLGGRGLVITGANMSGKSTYLRTLGVASVLARAINTVPAVSWNGRPLAVRTLIGRNDDIMLGKSYYQIEADCVVDLLRRAQSDPPTVFLLDELLRGTNTVERLAAGEAVVRALLDRGGGSAHSVVVATHDAELVNMLRDSFDPWHFKETLAGGVLTFEYRRLPGPATTRTALALLAASGAPNDVLARARDRAAILSAAAG